METVTCPNCGEENPAKFRLCGFCGHALAPALPPQEERKTVTVFFSDLKGSTNLGEALDPESLREVMTRYFDAMTLVLRRHGATIEKFIGDAIMAVFGLPKLHEDDALRAVRAAKETQAALAALNEDLQRTYGVQLTVRTGVNTGEVVSGDPTTGQRLVTGDTVNVAARLEQAAPANEVLIGDLTYRLVRGAVEVEEVEPLELKGKAERVPAFRLLAVSDATEGFERRQDAPMVGREREMASLGAMFQRAVDERSCRMATVVADAGVGKSRLVAEFTGSLADQAAVIRGRCLPYGEGITFWPLLEAARDAAGIEQDDPPEVARQKLAALTDDEGVTARLSAAIGLSNEPFPMAETFWAARRFLEILGRQRPVVLVIDDIHWAEATFLDLVGQLVESVEDASVLLLCTSRHDLLELHPDWATDANSQRVVLQPLTDADAARVVAGLLGEAGIAGEVQQRIVRASEGNPLFVEQLLSMMIDTGALHNADGRWESTGDLSDVDVPPSIHALLAARLDLLGREERSVIEPASVIGVTFAQAAVAVLAPDPVRPKVPDHLASMARKQLVRPPRGSADAEEAAFRFAHILIRDAAYGGLLKRARATLHERFADWADELNERQGRSQEYEEILGYHLEQAYSYLAELGTVDDHARSLGSRAATKLASAGRRAMARGDMPAAVNLLRRAAAVLPAGERAHLELLPDLGEALMELGEFESAQDVLTEASSGARTLDDEALVCRAELVTLLVKSYSGELEDWSGAVSREVDDALGVFERAGDDRGSALAWRLRAIYHGTAGRYAEMAVASEHIVNHARRGGDRRMEARGSIALAAALLYGPTPVAEAISESRSLTENVASDRRTRAVVEAQLAQLLAMNGDVDGARRLYEGARAALGDLGAHVLASSVSLDSARVEMLAGDLDRAEIELRRDYDALLAMNERFLLSSIGSLLARVLERRGRADEAEALTRNVEEIAAMDDVDAQAGWRGVRARILASRGEADEASRLAGDAVALRRNSDSPVLLAEALEDLAAVQRAGGDAASASASLDEALALASGKQDLATANRLEALKAST
jgi:class 3 adenylate cyclase